MKHWNIVNFLGVYTSQIEMWVCSVQPTTLMDFIKMTGKSLVPQIHARYQKVVWSLVYDSSQKTSLPGTLSLTTQTILDSIFWLSISSCVYVCPH